MDFAELTEVVRSLPIKEVLEKNGVVFKNGNGVNLQALSPFRKDAHFGSFNINTNMNIFHDWNLDICGDPIKFYEVFFNLEFVDAVKKLGEDFGISYEGRITKRKIRQVLPPKKEKPLDLDKISFVYNSFLDLISLSDQDRLYLKNTRHMTEKEIDFFRLKTYPRRNILLRKSLEEKVITKYGSTNVLFEIPGFFKKEGEIFNFPRNDGIIIPQNDEKGRTVGIQIRLRKSNPTSSKYFWMSSINCRTDNSFKAVKNGRSPGSPMGVIYTKNKAAKEMFITEGFFKAYTIVKTFRRPVAIVNGIGNWRSHYKDVIEGLKKNYPQLKRVIIAYDADMCYNYNVVRQAAALGVTISKTFPLEVCVLYWNEKNGKGIDDLIYNNSDYKHLIRSIPIKEFQVLYEKMKNEMNNDTTKEETKVIFDNLCPYN